MTASRSPGHHAAATGGPLTDGLEPRRQPMATALRRDNERPNRAPLSSHEMGMPRRWDADEDRRLRELDAAGLCLAAISAELCRSYKSVAARRKRLKLPPRHQPRAWSPGETALLVAAVQAGIPAAAVAERLGRSVDSVRNRRRTLTAGSRCARPYLPAEDAAIRDCFLASGDVAELAQLLGRSPDALRLRAELLGVHEPDKRRRWMAWEDAVLREGYSAALSCREIAQQLAGRSPGAVAARARKLGLADFGRAWTLRDDARLRALWVREPPVEQIAEALVRTPEAVRARCRKLGLVSPVRLAEPSARRWTAAEDEVLARHAAANPATLARWLKRSDRAVTQRMRKLGLTRPGVRSPHHPAPRGTALSPAERRVARREGADDPARALVVAARLGRAPRAIREAARAG